MDSKLFDSGYPIKIGGEEFTASMLTDRDFGDIDNYIKAQYVNTAYMAAENLSVAERKELTTIALNNAANITWESREGNDLIFSREGIIRLGWQMCRKRHPNLPFKVFYELAHKNLAESIFQIEAAYVALTPKMDEEDVGGSSTENKKSA